jgi:GNAT superfamily N-acetyltransferase
MDLRIEPCGPEAAEIVHRLTQEAYSGYDKLDPPSGAGRETPETVRADLAAHGGAIASVGGRPVGCLRLESNPDRLYVRRVAVPPADQGRGIGSALMSWAEAEAVRRGLTILEVGVRLSLPGNIAFYERLGYGAIARACPPRL